MDVPHFRSADPYGLFPSTLYMHLLPKMWQVMLSELSEHFAIPYAKQWYKAFPKPIGLPTISDYHYLINNVMSWTCLY
jgi:hypothetical protein